MNKDKNKEKVKVEYNELSEELTEQISEAYENSNYAGLEKLYNILKKTNVNIKKSEIKQFLDEQEEEQILKQTIVPPKEEQGHIVAIFPNENWQMDIFDLSKYEHYNHGYKYLFAVVDIFTRKLFAVPMKNKNIDSTLESIQSIIKLNEMKPNVLTSDNDSSFLGHKFVDYLKKENILLMTNVKDDHNALGIIDNMARRLKLAFGKIFLKTKKKNWSDHLSKVINNYNNSPHSALDDISPNDATSEKNEIIIRHINLSKTRQNQVVSDLEIGDKVRIKISTIFTKSSEPQFSDKVYKVTEVNGKKITLDNDTVKKRENLLKVPDNAKDLENNVIKEVNKENKSKKFLKQESIEPENEIKETFRIRKQTQFYKPK